MLVSPENFLKREHGLPFKNLRVWNIFWWEIIRYEASNVDTITTSKTPLKIQKKHRQYSFVDTIICLAKLRKCNILVLNHERRFYRCGKYIDQNTSTLVNDLYTAGKRVAVLQSAMTKATYNEEVSTINFVGLIKMIKIIFLFLFPLLYLRIWVDRSISGVLSAMDISNKLDKRVLVRRLYHFLCQFIACFIIMKITRSKMLVVVPGPGNEGAINAGKLLKNLVVEIQHGTPVFGKINYTYPKKMNRVYAPNVFMKSGPKLILEKLSGWQNVKFFTLGNARLTEEKKTYKKTKSQYDLLILGQPAVDKELHRLVMKIVVMDSSKRILIRPHPSALSVSFWKIIEQTENIFISEPSEHELVRDIFLSKKVLGGFSTALYEADFLGREVGVLKTRFVSLVKNKFTRNNWPLLDYKNILPWINKPCKIPKSNRKVISEYHFQNFLSMMHKLNLGKIK